MQPLLFDSPIRAITYKTGIKICSSLAITRVVFRKTKAQSARIFLQHDMISCLFGFCPHMYP